jgi:2-desacetyl-2-hydroxyethyl bacteriochlorophyllide A dehydrogenase
MNTLALEEPGRFGFRGVTAPVQPITGEALVRVSRVGICGTDLHAWEGKQPFFQYPRILGHELAVEVAAVGDGVTRVSVGDKCAVRPYLACGQCLACRKGTPNCCMQIRVLGVHIDGGMQDWLTIPAEYLHKSAKLSLEELALVEPLSIGAHGVWRSAIGAGETALVIGAGPIGLAVVAGVRAAGAKFAVMEVSPKRMQFCKQHAGVEICLDATGDALAQAVDAFGGDLPGVVFDCTGNPKSMMSAFRYVAHGGKLVFVGLYPGEITFSDPEFHKREMTILASRNATGADFDRVIAALEAGRILTAPWIEHRYTPESLVEAFPALLNPELGVLKPLVNWSTT